jgi:hypothetical protein
VRDEVPVINRKGRQNMLGRMVKGIL